MIYFLMCSAIRAPHSAIETWAAAWAACAWECNLKLPALIRRGGCRLGRRGGRRRGGWSDAPDEKGEGGMGALGGGMGGMGMGM